ncbi:uncharacterized protein AAEQ78_020933 isoform 1-T1 [Lycaon pictus]
MKRSDNVLLRQGKEAYAGTRCIPLRPQKEKMKIKTPQHHHLIFMEHLLCSRYASTGALTLFTPPGTSHPKPGNHLFLIHLEGTHWKNSELSLGYHSTQSDQISPGDPRVFHSRRKRTGLAAWPCPLSVSNGGLWTYQTHHPVGFLLQLQLDKLLASAMARVA